ncbi:hypothetical protein NP493_866g01045 [Ridgeia piscesae]|uniref:Uncharacterized protein n=1 Tax=Ridgeia piscesae TaxID=27915 RepID=A0AAD9NKN9_RIDPI|nr:hypothetical protein NP493_866g01045 [Ridgeia piscesae]
MFLNYETSTVVCVCVTPHTDQMLMFYVCEQRDKRDRRARTRTRGDVACQLGCYSNIGAYVCWCLYALEVLIVCYVSVSCTSFEIITDNMIGMLASSSSSVLLCPIPYPQPPMSIFVMKNLSHGSGNVSLTLLSQDENYL